MPKPIAMIGYCHQNEKSKDADGPENEAAGQIDRPDVKRMVRRELPADDAARAPCSPPASAAAEGAVGWEGAGWP